MVTARGSVGHYHVVRFSPRLIIYYIEDAIALVCCLLHLFE